MPSLTKYSRSRQRILGGVCGMIARETGVDVSLVRLGAVVLSFFSFGTVLVLYLVGWSVLPMEGEVRTVLDTVIDKGKQGLADYQAKRDAKPSAEPGPAPADKPVFDPYSEN